MSINEKMTALADAIREKSGCTDTLSIDDMITCVNGIFPAFYAFANGSGGAYFTFENVPFECNLVSVMLRWGIGNLGNNEVYSVFYNGASSDSRYRKRNGSSTTPYNVPDTVKVTNTKNEDGTYNVKIYCDGCIFSSAQPYVVFLAGNN